MACVSIQEMHEWAREEEKRILCASEGKDWRKVPIDECGEPLVEIPPQMVFPYYCRELKLTSETRQYARKGVLERLLQAADFLKEYGYDLVVFDAWRPVDLQETLFWQIMWEYTIPQSGWGHLFQEISTDELKACFSFTGEGGEGWGAKLMEANRQFVSLPSTDPTRPSPHLTGGAMDVWLYREGQPVPMGVPFDHMDEKAGAFYHLREDCEWLDGSPEENRKRRTLLLYAMGQCGFTVWRPEFWHHNLGNQMYGLVNGGKAWYSAIAP